MFDQSNNLWLLFDRPQVIQSTKTSQQPSFDRPKTENRKQLLGMLHRFVKLVNASQLRLLVLYDLKSMFI